MVEQAPRLAALDRNVVADVAPVEDAVLGRAALLVLFVRAVLAVPVVLCLVGKVLRRRSLNRRPVSMAAPEDQHLALGAAGGHQLGRDDVQRKEKDHERGQDAQVAPQMAVAIGVAALQDDVADHKVLAGGRAGGGAGARVGGDARVGGHELGAGELAAVAELVDDEALVGVGDGVDVGDPAQPALHGARGQHEAGVDDEGDDEDGGGREGLVDGARGLADGAQDGGHGEGAGEAEEQKDEEVVGAVAQVGHEVEGDVEGERRQDLGGQLAEGGGDGLGGGAVEGIAGVLLDDGTLRVEGEDLQPEAD